ncbi:MAG TPA: DUF1203 domain-containing protein [Parvularcula sp.]|nr:DUF1203 domain-containing protein [Parvularcula sp.]HBS31962.1 DUF1203 domain-containing protein [Parvularcula sp.]HBS34840.1 DUF1203 domain-containing protein [Parvularcula sp.]
MSFIIRGLDPAEFRPLFALSDEALAARGIVAKIVDMKPGFPCRISLEDADPGERVLLLNYESHRAPTPYRSAYAIYVRDCAAAGVYRDALPPVMEKRPIALRIFDADGMLIGADLGREGAETKAKIEAIFENPAAAYIHAHNAMHGCFAAEVRRA